MEEELAEKLDPAARQVALEKLAGWSYDAAGDAIVRELKFKDFSETFAIMTRIALLAEKAGHHPEWTNSYNKLRISLSTHDAGGLSDKDVDLAGRIDALLD